MKHVKTYESFNLSLGNTYYLIVTEDGKYFIPNSKISHLFNKIIDFYDDGEQVNHYFAITARDVDKLTLNEGHYKISDVAYDNEESAQNFVDNWNWYIDQNIVESDHVDFSKKSLDGEPGSGMRKAAGLGLVGENSSTDGFKGERIKQKLMVEPIFVGATSGFDIDI